MECVESEDVGVPDSTELKSAHAQTDTDSFPNQSETESIRNYSPYYTPKPKVGAKGKPLGRGSVKEEYRKVQFTMTCTQEQMERFKKAAAKDNRKLYDFMCAAAEEYISEHNL